MHHYICLLFSIYLNILVVLILLQELKYEYQYCVVTVLELLTCLLCNVLKHWRDLCRS